MEIKGKIHLFFEQSGTFKNEFIKLGYNAQDYDIQNNFGETNHIIDLFKEIEKAFEDKTSIFDDISEDDLIMAFFPCIYFCENNRLYFNGEHNNQKHLSNKSKIRYIIERARSRQMFYERIMMLMSVCENKNLRLIVENLYSTQHFLYNNFPYKITLIDYDRRRRGDLYKKPTAYWFVNCEAEKGFTNQPISKDKMKSIASSKAGIESGICSEDRSMISSDYARNFICDNVLGKTQPNIETTLFDFIS